MSQLTSQAESTTTTTTINTSPLNPEICALIDAQLTKYPADQKASAILPALHIVQEHHDGWLSRELLDAVADYLDMPHVAVYEIATFYTMFELSPVGNHMINVCTNVSCMLRGSEQLVNHLEQRLGAKLGETTADGCFTLREVECMGACVNAPMCQINKDYHENLTIEKLDKLLDSLQQKNIDKKNIDIKNIDKESIDNKTGGELI